MYTLGEVKKLEKSYRKLSRTIKTLKKYHLIPYQLYDYLMDKVYSNWESIYNY